MKLMLFLLVIMSSTAFGQLYRLTVTNCGAMGAGAACDAFTQKLEDEVNANFPDVPDLSEFSEGMGNAAAVGSKGSHNSDYVNEVSIAQVGLGVGVGLDVGDGSISDLGDDVTSLGGFALNPVLSVGLNPNFIPVDKIGPIEMDRLRLFGNFMSYKMKQDDQDINMEAKLTSFGFRARYHLIDGKGVSSLLKWGGVHVTTGYQYHSMKLDAAITVTESVTDGGAGGTVSGTGTLSGDITTHSIPIEISTYAQIGYVFSVFGGLGTDLSYGSSELSFDIDTTVAGSGTAAGFVADGDANLSGDGAPSPLLFRAFAGIQINVPILKIYIQGQRTLSKNVYGISTGIKLNW